MDQSAYQAACIVQWQADLDFRKAQETATQKRHEESQAYGADYLTLLARQHAENLQLTAAATAANVQRAQAEQALAAAALEAAKVQRETAALVAGDLTQQIVEQAISRMNDRTGTTSTADIPRAVREVLETLNEARRQLKSHS